MFLSKFLYQLIHRRIGVAEMFHSAVPLRQETFGYFPRWRLFFLITTTLKNEECDPSRTVYILLKIWVWKVAGWPKEMLRNFATETKEITRWESRPPLAFFAGMCGDKLLTRYAQTNIETIMQMKRKCIAKFYPNVFLEKHTSFQHHFLFLQRTSLIGLDWNQTFSAWKWEGW